MENAVEEMRRIRARISQETEGMSWEELCAYYEEGSRRYRELDARERAEEELARQQAARAAGGQARPEAAAPAESRD